VARQRRRRGRSRSSEPGPSRTARHSTPGRGLAVNVNRLHWLTAGAASFARGLNDTPKIVAVAAFALVPTGITTAHLAVPVAGAMAGRGIIGGLRVARRLGDDVVAMDHLDGAKANLASAALVGLGATRGLPLSLTHVSTGAIAGTARTRLSRLNRRTLEDFVLAWTATPVVAGAVAASGIPGCALNRSSWCGPTAAPALGLEHQRGRNHVGRYRPAAPPDFAKTSPRLCRSRQRRS
jgi:phosphate/sulfate permease